MATITLEQVKRKCSTDVYNYFKDNNLDGKDLNTIAKTFFKDGKNLYFLILVEKLDLEQYLDEYKDVLIENIINARCNRGRTPLHIASYYGHTEIAKLLIANGVDVNAKDKDDKTPLHIASYCGRLEIAKLLIDNKADVDARDNYNATPLHYISAYGCLEIAELLIDNKADVNARDRGGKTPLHEASYCRRTEIAELLIANGARK